MRACGLWCVAAVCCGAALAQDSSAPPVTFGTTVVIPAGLRGEVYKIRHWTSHLPDFSKLHPKGAIYTDALDVPAQDFKQGFPGVTKRFEWFAIDYTGRFWITTPGLYRFALTSDDGARLYLDGQLIVDNDGMHPPETREGSLQLATGVHRMRVSYFQGPRFQVALVLKVAAPGGPLHVFSTREFKPPPDADIGELQ